MTDVEWDAHWVRSIGVRLDGAALGERADDGKALVDDDLLILLNAHTEEVLFQLPETLHGGSWELLVDTSLPHLVANGRSERARYAVAGRSLVLLCSPRGA
jgi:glycogen operon protein